MANKWDVYSRQGIDLASAATSYGFSAVKSGTRLGFRVARGITDTAVGLTSTVVDHVLFGGSTVVRPVAGSAVESVFTLAEQFALAPIHLSEYITSTSLIAAHSSINVLSVIFPGSSEASFSLASFITLVRREWSDRSGLLPNKNYGLTQIARAVVAWVALQGVTQEWQEKRWLQYLKELDVMEQDRSEYERPTLRKRRNSKICVTSDVIFPGRGGPQIIAANIGEAPQAGGLSAHSRNSTLPSFSSLTMTSTKRTPSPTVSRVPSIQQLSRASSRQQLASPTSPSSRGSFHSHSSDYPFPTSHPPEPQPLPFEELKSTLRRLSKMVLAGYGGASLLFFGVAPHMRSSDTEPGEAGDKREEEAKLEVAVDAAEAEAVGDDPGLVASQSQSKYSWWSQLMGRYDRDIFEQSVLRYEEEKNKDVTKKGKATDKAKRDKMKATAIIGTEHLMPRFWVLTDYNRRQIVLVLRGTMSLNEIAVDLTCHPEPFQPAETDYFEFFEEETDQSNHFQGRFMSRRKAQDKEKKPPPYFVHSGMVRMAKAMGDVGKPVQLAVQEALYNNPGFDLVLCGHSLGAGVAAILGLMWADPNTCLTVYSSGHPAGRRVYVYCFAPPALTDAKLSNLSKKLVTSFVYSHDIVGRLSLGSVRDLRNAALWLCEAEEGKHQFGKDGKKLQDGGWSTVTSRARRWKEARENGGRGSQEDMDWLIAVRKTLEANMQDQDLFPPGRVLWGMRDGDLHPSHQKKRKRSEKDQDRLRVFEVLDVEKVFDQIVFARNMLTAHLPHQYDRALHDLL